MNTEESLKGHLLIASASLGDPNFRQTVVLMVHHDTEGALGLVLNRPTDMRLQELWDKIAEEPCPSDQLLYIGGPVEGPLMALHTHPDQSEAEIFDGVYFSVQKDHLNVIVAREGTSFRLFAGHAGWGGGQLENELSEGAWHTLKADLSLVFGESESLWESVFRTATKVQGLAGFMNIRKVPDDPNLN